MEKTSLIVLIFLVFTSSGLGFDETDLRKLLNTKVCPKCNLSKADLSEADLGGADLKEANLGRASLFMADLSRSDLTGNKSISDAILCETITPWGGDSSGCQETM